MKSDKEKYQGLVALRIGGIVTTNGDLLDLARETARALAESRRAARERRACSMRWIALLAEPRRPRVYAVEVRGPRGETGGYHLVGYGRNANFRRVLCGAIPGEWQRQRDPWNVRRLPEPVVDCEACAEALAIAERERAR